MKKEFLPRLVSASVLYLILGLVGFAVAAGKGKPGGEPPVTAMKQEIVTVQDAGKQRRQIVVMNADGTDVQVVLVGERHARFADVSWSGDGSKILFWGEVNGQSGIYWVQVFELNGDGTRKTFAPLNPVFVTTTGSGIPNPVWSPKKVLGGKEWIAYWDDWQIWLVDPIAPHEKIRLSEENTTRLETHPTWSPDAGRIGILSAEAEVGCSCPADVEILELDLDVLGKITVAKRVSLIVDNPYLPNALKQQLTFAPFWETDWANNAEWIAIGHSSSNLWLFPTNQGDVAQYVKDLTADPELGYHHPVWSPGDDALLFTREGYGGRCDVPNNNDQPPLQGGPSSRVIAPLFPTPPNQIDSLDICNDVTFPFDLVGNEYDWWRGGEGIWR